MPTRRAFLESTPALFGGAALTAGFDFGPLHDLTAGLQATGGEYQLPPLPYAYDALEPAIDAETMRLHHDLHHAGYVRGLNAALEGLAGRRGCSQ